MRISTRSARASRTIRQGSGRLWRTAYDDGLSPIIRPAALRVPKDRDGEDEQWRHQRRWFVIPVEYELVDPSRSFHRLHDELLLGGVVRPANDRHYVEVRGSEPTSRETISRTTDRDDQADILRRCLDSATDHDTCQ